MSRATGTQREGVVSALSAVEGRTERGKTTATVGTEEGDIHAATDNWL